jgi:hypothetical protein
VIPTNFDTVPQIRSLRRQLCDNGYSICAITRGKKFPWQKDWTNLARQNPPHALVNIDLRMPGTGIPTDGLRVIDVDINTAPLAKTMNEYVTDAYGIAPLRYRDGSPRRAHLYQAEIGMPPKSSCKNKLTGDGVEVLGYGNQVFAYGIHPDSGEPLRWINGPHLIHRRDLPVLTVEQTRDIIQFASKLVGADRASVRAMDAPIPLRAATGEEWPLGDIVAALTAIPNTGKDWNFWFQIAAAVFDASNGSGDGFQAFQDWSYQCSPGSGSPLWRSLHDHPPNQITAGSLPWYARQHDPDWDRPSYGGFSRLRIFSNQGV